MKKLVKESLKEFLRPQNYQFNRHLRDFRAESLETKSELNAAILATGNGIVARRLLKQAKIEMRKQNISFSESIEYCMKNSKIWKGFKHLK